MQLRSYGSFQPPEGQLRIPRTREKRAEGESCRSNTRARERKNAPSVANGTWGGARNRRDRVTTALSQHQAEGILKAMAVSELAGMPLNRHWTVDYENAGITDKDGAAFVAKLLGQCRRYARAKGGCFAAVWVREIGWRNGAHAHIAMHWPSGWKLGHLTRRWIKQAGGTYSKGVSLVNPIGRSLVCAETSAALYRANLEVLAGYLLKGSGKAVVAELGLKLVKPSGPIVGKRCGWTQNLGKANQSVRENCIP